MKTYVKAHFPEPKWDEERQQENERLARQRLEDYNRRLERRGGIETGQLVLGLAMLAIIVGLFVIGTGL